MSRTFGKTAILFTLITLVSACGPAAPMAAATAGPTPQPTGGGVVHGWAVLAEKDYQPHDLLISSMGRLREIQNNSTMDSARPSSTQDYGAAARHMNPYPECFVVASLVIEDVGSRENRR